MNNKQLRKEIYNSNKRLSTKLKVLFRIEKVRYKGVKTYKFDSGNQDIRLYESKINIFNPLLYICFILWIFVFMILKLFIGNLLLLKETVLDIYEFSKLNHMWVECGLDRIDFSKIKQGNLR